MQELDLSLLNGLNPNKTADPLFKRPQNNPQEFYWFAEGFTKEELKQIEEGVAEIPAEEATTFGETTESIRSSSVRWIPMNEKWGWVYNKLKAYIEEANNELWNFDLVSMPEEIQYTEYYDANNGHYGWHQDIGPGVGSHRKISITVQLSDSDEYEGGDLQLMYGTNSIVTAARGAGVVVIFPSYMMHQVTQVTKGTRKSFVLWVGGDHFK